MNVSKTVLANAFALAGGIYYIGCYLLALVAPQFFLNISASWFHMIDLEKIAKMTTTNLTTLITGLVTLALSAWLFGYILGWSIEVMNKKK